MHSLRRHEKHTCQQKNKNPKVDRPSREAKETANERIRNDTQSNTIDANIQEQKRKEDQREERKFSTGPQ